MTTTMRTEFRYSLEFSLLLALAFFLPLYEAPKNIFWLAYVGTWLVNRLRDGNWGGRWDSWDTLIAAWIASGYVVALFAGTHDTEWNGAADILRYGAILWCLRRSGYTGEQLLRLGGMVLASCVIALAWGFWRHFVTHERLYVELHSVGHVNHSAPYLAICAGLVLSWLFATWRRWRAAHRTLASLALVFIVTGLVVGSSRAAVGAMAVAVLVLGLLWKRRSAVPLRLAVVFLIVAGVLAAAGNLAVIEKQRYGIKSGDYLAQRGTIWNRAFVAWQANPWFGVGIDNFGMITDDMLRRQVESGGKKYVPEDYRGPNHAHSLYFNTLAERGLFGSTIFAAVMLAWAMSLWRKRPAAADADTVWTYWGASISAWIVVMGAGLFNTTLHHEIAILAVLMLGGWMAAERAQPRSQSAA